MLMVRSIVVNTPTTIAMATQLEQRPGRPNQTHGSCACKCTDLLMAAGQKDETHEEERYAGSHYGDAGCSSSESRKFHIQVIISDLENACTQSHCPMCAVLTHQLQQQLYDEHVRVGIDDAERCYRGFSKRWHNTPAHSGQRLISN